ncbi:hypothetical protein ACJJTC_018553 [Scirpophaga incertulas]
MAVGSKTTDPLPRSADPVFTMEQVMSLVNSVTKQDSASAVSAALSSETYMPSRQRNNFYLLPFDPDERFHDIRDCREFRYSDDVNKWRSYTSDQVVSYADYATTAWTLFKQVRPEASTLVPPKLVPRR